MTIIDVRDSQRLPQPTRGRVTDLRDVAQGGFPELVDRASPLPSDLVVLANRLPVTFNGDSWETSAGGLVTALLPALAGQQGSWIGWSGGDRAARSLPRRHCGVTLGEVPLTRDDIDGFYDGFSNNTLWPLYHDAIRTPTYQSDWWEAYVRVNHRFALSAARSVSRGGTVWVHDYHLQLVPEMLRALRPDVRIGFFLHIPFPPAELFAQLPWRKAILRGLLGADVVGFQEPAAASNFRRLVRTVGAVSLRGTHVGFEGRRVHVGAFPISIDVNRFEELASSQSVAVRAREVRAELGSPEHVLLGVDRLDYTKGIDLRLKAYASLLRDGVLDPRKSVLVQIAIPSRENVHDYLCQRELVERLVGEINGEFGRVGAPAVHYLHRQVDVAELVALYRAADAMLVTPLRDGMNLVAKEYIASRVDGRGALVLSEFAGSARELKAAELVNPHDIDDLKASISTVLRRSPLVSARRMRELRRAVRRNDVYRWSESFLSALGAA